MTACGGGGSPADALAAGAAVTGKYLDVVMVQATSANPALVNGTCVIFTPMPGLLELVPTVDELNYPVFRHIGQGIQDCLAGRALPYISQIPSNSFFHQMLNYDLNGQCSASWAVGCFGSGLVHVVTSVIPSRVVSGTSAWDDYVSTILGHETWHAYDLCFHGCSTGT
jgi:hypothetical protein